MLPGFLPLDDIGNSTLSPLPPLPAEFLLWKTVKWTYLLSATDEETEAE